MAYFSAMIQLEEKQCLVVGAGHVAERKIRKLLQAKASVTVVSPQATANIRQWAVEKELVWRERPFQTTDVQESTLVVAATNNPEVNLHVYHSVNRNQWINVIDRPDLSSFIFPAIVERGGLQLSISTAGGYPGLAKKLRKELEEQFGPEYEEYLLFLVDIRQKVLSMKLPKEVTSKLLREFLKDCYLQAARAGKLEECKVQAYQLIEEAKYKSD